MISANAKINLSLAITGRHIGNYHELVSLNVPIDICDKIALTSSDCWDFACSDHTLTKDNTILKIVEQLRPILAKKYHIKLEKYIPKLSGFGGGSSDATAVLKFLNVEENLKLDNEMLTQFAKNVGADCPFFVQNKPAIVSGIGDIVSPIDEKIIKNLKKYQLIVFKPQFNIETKLAYQKLRTTYRHLYTPHSQAIRSINKLLREILNFSPKLSLFNTFSDIAFSKNNKLRTLQKKLASLNINFMLSGSGSGCFCLFQDPAQSGEIIDTIKNIFPEKIFIQQTKII